MAFYLLQTIIGFAAPVAAMNLFPNGGEYLLLVLEASRWVANIIFGFAMWINLRSDAKVANAVGLLSVFHPIFGAAFFLLATSISKE